MSDQNVIYGGQRHASAPQMGAKVPVKQVHWALKPETNPWFWNPGRIGIELAPESFRTKLHDLDPNLEAAWNREDERWAVWVKAPRIQHPICQGWKLLFVVKDSSGGYVPLDERTLAKVYSISGDKWGSGRHYFDAVVREMEREREAIENWDRADTMSRAGEYFDYTKPKVGFGAISSSKAVGQ